MFEENSREISLVSHEVVSMKVQSIGYRGFFCGLQPSANVEEVWL